MSELNTPVLFLKQKTKISEHHSITKFPHGQTITYTLNSDACRQYHSKWNFHRIVTLSSLLFTVWSPVLKFHYDIAQETTISLYMSPAITNIESWYCTLFLFSLIFLFFFSISLFHSLFFLLSLSLYSLIEIGRKYKRDFLSQMREGYIYKAKDHDLKWVAHTLRNFCQTCMAFGSKQFKCIAPQISPIRFAI